MWKYLTISNYFFNLTAVHVLDTVTAHKARPAHPAARALPQPGFNPRSGRRVYRQVPQSGTGHRFNLSCAF